jgi:hypothetical protein
MAVIFLRTILNSTCIVFKGCTAFFVLQRRRITEFCVENLSSFDGTYEARRRGVNLKMQKTKQTWEQKTLLQSSSIVTSVKTLTV